MHSNILRWDISFKNPHSLVEGFPSILCVNNFRQTTNTVFTRISFSVFGPKPNTPLKRGLPSPSLTQNYWSNTSALRISGISGFAPLTALRLVVGTRGAINDSYLRVSYLNNASHDTLVHNFTTSQSIQQMFLLVSTTALWREHCCSTKSLEWRSCW